MKPIPSSSRVAEQFAADREQRRDQHLLQMAYRNVPTLLLKEWAQTIGMLFAKPHQRETWDRKNDMDAQEKRFILGVSKIKALQPRYIPSSLMRPMGDDFVSDFARDGVASVIQFLVDYEREEIAVLDPEERQKQSQTLDNIHKHIQLTGDYAWHLADEWNHATGSRINPYAADSMGRLRNVSMLMGIRGYHEKHLRSKEVCEQLEIHPDFIETFMKPMDVDSSGLHRDQYRNMSGMQRQSAADRRKAQIWPKFTPERKIVEFAGVLAKFSGDRLQSFDEIMDGARSSRTTPEQYINFVGQKPTFLAARSSTDCLNPEFEGIWEEMYREMKQEFEAEGIDFEVLRQQIAQRNGLRV